MKQSLIGRRCLLWMLCSLMAVNSVWAERVAEHEDALVANHFMNTVSVHAGAKKAPARRMVRKNIKEEAHYFIFENANGEGWILVAADDAAHPILAYSHTGQFRTENQPENLKEWLDNYDLQIRMAEQQGLQADEIYIAPLPDEGETPGVLPDVYLAGQMNDWSATANKFTPAADERTASLTLNLAKQKYEFKIVSGGKWLGKSGDDGLYRVHRDWPEVDSFDKINTDGTNIELKADVAGSYTFTWVYADKTLLVSFPDKPYVERRLQDGYYLIGSKQAWNVQNVTANMLFMTNDFAYGEFMLNANLEIGDEIKVVWVEEDEIVQWYPDGENTNYVITALTAGSKTIYFRPDFHADWNGHIYIAPNEATAIENTAITDNTSTLGIATKLLRNGQILILLGEKVYTVTGQEVK